jgi:hypothetical protein
MNITDIKTTGVYYAISILEIKKHLTIIGLQSLEIWLKERISKCTAEESSNPSAVHGATENTYLVVDSILSSYITQSKNLDFNFNDKITFDYHTIGTFELIPLTNDTISIFTVCKTRETGSFGREIINSAINYIKSNSSYQSIKHIWLAIILDNPNLDKVLNLYVSAGFKSKGVNKIIPGGIYPPNKKFWIELVRSKELNYVSEYEINNEMIKSNKILSKAKNEISRMTYEQIENTLYIDTYEITDVSMSSESLYVIKLYEIFNLIQYSDKERLFKIVLNIRREKAIRYLYSGDIALYPYHTHLVLKVDLYEELNRNFLLENLSDMIYCIFDIIDISDNSIGMFNFSMDNVSSMKTVLYDIFNYLDISEDYVMKNSYSIILPTKEEYIKQMLQHYSYFNFKLPEYVEGDKYKGIDDYFIIKTDKNSYLNFLSEDEERVEYVLNENLFACKKIIEYKKAIDGKGSYEYKNSNVSFTKQTLDKLRRLLTSSYKVFGLVRDLKEENNYEYSGAFKISSVKTSTDVDRVELQIVNVNREMKNERLENLPEVFVGTHTRSDAVVNISFSFHTHPLSIQIGKNLSIMCPSDGDIEANTVYNEYNNKRLISHFVITREGIYSINRNLLHKNRFFRYLDKEASKLMLQNPNENKQIAYNKIFYKLFEYPLEKRKHANIETIKQQGGEKTYYNNEVKKYMEWLNSNVPEVIKQYINIQFLSWDQLKAGGAFSIMIDPQEAIEMFYTNQETFEYNLKDVRSINEEVPFYYSNPKKRKSYETNIPLRKIKDDDREKKKSR